MIEFDKFGFVFSVVGLVVVMVGVYDQSYLTAFFGVLTSTIRKG